MDEALQLLKERNLIWHRHNATLIPCVSIDRPYCLRSGERVPVRLVPKTKRFADFCTIKFQDQLKSCALLFFLCYVVLLIIFT